MEIETWKDIKGFEKLYQISNLGRVKSLTNWAGNKNISKYIQREKILKAKPKKNGYCIVTLRHQNQIKYKSVHRLVAEAFLPNPNNYPIINHIDGDKTNNVFSNLEWCTYKHNTREAIRMGLSNPYRTLKRWKSKFGKEHNRSKLVYQINNNTGEIINEFYGVREASRITNIKFTDIYHSIHRKNKLAGGYNWKYGS